MKAPFTDPFFQAQWLRAAGQAVAGGADLGECFAIAEAIREGDGESWRSAWTTFADRLSREGEASLKAGRRQSAHETFLRASNYYRAGTLFDLEPGATDRLRAGYRLQRDAFRQAIAAREGWAEAIGIPFEGAVLPGYLFRAEGEGAKPTLIITGGYDGTAEELYFYSGSAALARGWNVLAYDGPGQGGALVEGGLLFRPDWESVLDAVMAAIAPRPEVDRGRIALMGLSFGGYLAPRAAASRGDLLALVADPGLFGLFEAMRARLPEDLASAVLSGDRSRLALIEPMLKARTQSLTEGWAFRRGLCVHGVETSIDYLALTAEYTLEGCVDRIACPTLVTEAEGDSLGATARRLYDSLGCPKVLQRFTKAEGAAEHCESGARALFNQRVFDWLDGLTRGADA